MKAAFLFLFLTIGNTLFAQKEKKPYVILISFDGFRHDYVSKFDAPNFKKFIRKGAAAKGLIPSFPSKTFPNHYTLVTGLYPGHHGLVDNQFYDPDQKKLYGMRDRSVVLDPSFYGGTPLWELVQQHGMRAASFFWVGSEVPVNGSLPDYYFRYDESTPNVHRVDQTIAWLKLPEKERPHFIALYFSFVDTQGHHTGTQSTEIKHAVAKADSLLGYLSKSLSKIDLPVNVVIVSDHGMLELKQEEPSYITLSKLFNITDTAVVYVNGGTQTHFYTRKADSLYHVLKKQEDHFKIYTRKMFPAQWHYDNNRSGDLLLVADPGYYIQPTAHSWEKNLQRRVFGVHGYDPAVVPEMQGIFYAMGPNIKAGLTVEPFSNIHVYPFIARILGLKIPPIDGDLKVLDEAYKK
jgi:predicted AlkP superfamily pyrophosphatase or phosphodiesterase